MSAGRDSVLSCVGMLAILQDHTRSEPRRAQYAVSRVSCLLPAGASHINLH
jgi:hypothetical protein